MGKVDLRDLDRYLEQEKFQEDQKKVRVKKKKESSIYKIKDKHSTK
jgi:hypothetical protein